MDLASRRQGTGAADAPVRLVQPRPGPRRLDGALVGPAVALPADRLSLPLARASSATAREAAARLDDPGLAGRPTTSSSRTTTRSSCDLGASGIAGNLNGHDPAGRQPVRRAAQPPLPEPASRAEHLRPHVRRRRQRSRPASLPAAGGDHLARIHGPVREPAQRLPLLRLLHALRLRGRRQGEPADDLSARRARRRDSTASSTHSKVLRIEVDDRRPRDGRDVRRPARGGALPARRDRRRLRIHAREQPAAAALTQQGAPARHRQRPRARRPELHVPDLPADGRRASGRARRLNMYMGNTCTITILYDYNGDIFDHEDVDFVGGMQLFSEPCEREPVNSVQGADDRRRQGPGGRTGSRALRQLGLLRRHQHRGRESSPTRTTSSTSTRTTRTRGAGRSSDSPSTGTTTRRRCGGSCTRARWRSCNACGRAAS